MIKNIFLFSFIILLFFSCGIKDGIVIQKWYEPSRTYVSLLPITISNGKTTSTMLIPYIIHDDEDFCIKIKKEKENNKDSKYNYNVLYLEKNEWNSIEIGDYVNYSSKNSNLYSMTDNNNTKERQ